MIERERFASLGQIRKVHTIDDRGLLDKAAILSLNNAHAKETSPLGETSLAELLDMAFTPVGSAVAPRRSSSHSTRMLHIGIRISAGSRSVTRCQIGLERNSATSDASKAPDASVDKPNGK